MQAIKALNTVDVFFLIDKGSAKDDLLQLRREICERHITGHEYRFVQASDPERDRTAEAYGAAVKDWHHRRAEIFERMIAEELGEDGVGAILVWGDPSLYDGTIRIVEELIERGNVAFEYSVIPGVSSLHALTARHRIPLNRIGEPIHITPGRLLADGMPPGLDNVVVMLDGDCAFRRVTDGRGHLLGRLPGNAGRNALQRAGSRTRTGDREGAGRSPGAQGLDHGHLPPAPPQGVLRHDPGSRSRGHQ